MSREKQIEEMARTLCGADRECRECYVGGGNCEFWIEASVLHNAGYRKQSEGEWIAKDNFNGRCTIATCSSCGVEKAFPVLVRIETISTLYPYCQKCGAKMKGGAE